MMRRLADLRSGPLWKCLVALDIRPGRVIAAIALGVAALGSALALAGLSAWLITRAWQMPPVLDLSVAVVAVRALGISRGIWRYCERLAGHDVALRAAAHAREAMYANLAGPEAPTSVLRNGTLLDRLSTDVDELAESIVRSLIPMAVAALLSVAAVVVIALISPVAATVLAVSFVAAAVLAPALAARAAATREKAGAQARSEHAESAMTVLEHSPELRVAGVLDDALARTRRRRRAWEDAQDAAVAPGAAAAAVPTVAMGASVLGALAAAVDLAGSVAPTTVAVLVLLPLAAFEASAALPAAAVGLSRSRVAAARLVDLLGARPDVRDAPRLSDTAPADLTCTDLTWRTGNTMSGPLSIAVPAGGRLALTGPSGAGKTSLLMTLCGLMSAASGSVQVGGCDIAALTPSELPSHIVLFAEDAHIFATTLRDNLLLARGDATDDEMTQALCSVGLSDWLAGLPDGLCTLLDAGSAAVSGGQRRRILLARAALSRAPVLLLDEPTEHLDTGDGAALLRELLDPNGFLLSGHTVVVATHHLGEDLDCPRVHLGDTVQV